MDLSDFESADMVEALNNVKSVHVAELKKINVLLKSFGYKPPPRVTDEGAGTKRSGVCERAHEILQLVQTQNFEGLVDLCSSKWGIDFSAELDARV